MNWMLMPLRRYAEFSGRSRRKEYWMFWLLNVLISLFVGLVFLVGYYADMSQTEMDTWLMPVVWLACLWSLATLVPGIAVTIRRLHDTDRSGWSILYGLIPFIGGFILLYFYVQEGTSGANAYGEDPLAAEHMGVPAAG